MIIKQRSVKFILKSVLMATLLLQSNLQASLLSTVKSYCSNLWQNNKPALMAASVGLTALGLYSYYNSRSSNTKSAQKLDVHIGIPISGAGLKSVENKVLRIQDRIKKAAAQNEYNLDTRSVEANGLHITLEGIPMVEKDDIKKYEECIESIMAETKPFDLTDNLSQSTFEVFETGWGVLNLPIFYDSGLAHLVQKLKAHLQSAGLRTAALKDFKVHISLGKFTTYKGASIPQNGNMHWVPQFQIKLPKESFLVKKIVLSLRKKIEDKKNKTITFQNEPDQEFRLLA